MPRYIDFFLPPLIWQRFKPNFMKLQEYFLCKKKTKIMTLLWLFLLSLDSPPSLLRVRRCMCVHSSAHTQGVMCSMSECQLLCQQHHTHALNNASRWFLWGEEIKSLFLFSLTTKSILIALQKNTVVPLHYFNDVPKFLSGPCLGSVRKLSDLIKNILICVLMMNEGLTGLEWHEGE